MILRGVAFDFRVKAHDDHRAAWNRVFAAGSFIASAHRIRGKLCWAPFVLMLPVMLMGFFGLAYSIFPFIVVDHMTIWQAASRPATLKILLGGAGVAIPAIGACTVLAYRVFRGKTTALTYA